MIPDDKKQSAITLSIERKIISCNNKFSRLQEKPLQVLLYLLKHNTRYVKSDELIENLWQGNSYTGQRGVINAIAKLRRAFAELTLNNIVENKPQVGYRLTATIFLSDINTINSIPKQNHISRVAIFGVILLIFSLIFIVFKSEDKQIKTTLHDALGSKTHIQTSENVLYFI